eukprot:1139105-Pelagomonas_calceolata.AAC.7
MHGASRSHESAKQASGPCMCDTNFKGVATIPQTTLPRGPPVVAATCRLLNSGPDVSVQGRPIPAFQPTALAALAAPLPAPADQGRAGSWLWG